MTAAFSVPIECKLTNEERPRAMFTTVRVLVIVGAVIGAVTAAPCPPLPRSPRRGANAADKRPHWRVAAALALSALLASVVPAHAATTISMSGACRYDIPALPGVDYTMFLADAVITGVEPSTVFAAAITTTSIIGTSASAWIPLLADATGTYGSWDDDVYLSGYAVPEDRGVETVTWDVTVYVDSDGDRMADADEVLGSTSLAVTCVRTVDELLEAALTDGSLSGGETSSLLSKVEAAGASLDRDNIKAAINQLTALISELQAAMQTGRISESLGNQLVTAAERQITELQARL